MIRVDRAWLAARLGQRGAMRSDMESEVSLMTDRELELVVEASQALLRAADRRLGEVEREKIRARVERFGHARGLKLRRRADVL